MFRKYYKKDFLKKKSSVVDLLCKNIFFSIK